MPMALYSFFDTYDFSGKTIIPFNVHNGSRFSQTIQTIEELEPEATVIENGLRLMSGMFQRQPMMWLQVADRTVHL